jgi:hypothetical protein
MVFIWFITAIVTSLAQYKKILPRCCRALFTQVNSDWTR